MALLTVEEAAKVIGTSPAYTRRLVRDRKIKGIKFGKEWIVEAVSVREFKPRKRVKKIGKGGLDA